MDATRTTSFGSVTKSVIKYHGGLGRKNSPFKSVTAKLPWKFEENGTVEDVRQCVYLRSGCSSEYIFSDDESVEQN